MQRTFFKIWFFLQNKPLDWAWKSVLTTDVANTAYFHFLDCKRKDSLLELWESVDLALYVVILSNILLLSRKMCRIRLLGTKKWWTHLLTNLMILTFLVSTISPEVDVLVHVTCSDWPPEWVSVSCSLTIVFCMSCFEFPETYPMEWSYTAIFFFSFLYFFPICSAHWRPKKVLLTLLCNSWALLVQHTIEDNTVSIVETAINGNDCLEKL